MSKTTFNGMEKFFITNALKHEIERLEEEVKESTSRGRNSLFAEGYFTMMGEELIAKVKSMTLKKDL